MNHNIMTHTHRMFFEGETGGGYGGGSAATLDAPPDRGGESSSAPSGGGLVGPDGSFVEGWTSKLPEELGDYRNGLAKFKNVADFARSYQGLEQKLGSKASMVAVPTDKSTPEEIAAYRKALGVPERPDGYQVRPEHLPEGFNWDDKAVAPFLSLAHKHNLPPTTVKAILDYELQREQLRSETIGTMARERLEAGQKVLKDTFGARYNESINLAIKAAKTVGVDVQSPGFSDPQVVIAFSRLAQKISDDQFVTNTGGSSSELSGAARAKDIQTNKQNPQHQRYREGDPDTVALVRSLLQQR